ncbi:MAG TPA: ADYC domain-containing protein [Kofleriaceae bacterium]
MHGNKPVGRGSKRLVPAGACEASASSSALAAASMAATIVGDCPHTGCGLNGAWLGSGVRFRTLHLTPGVQNDVNLTIAAFVDRRGRQLTLRIDREHPDVLIGIDPSNRVVQGECTSADDDRCLTGARLFLVPPADSDQVRSILKEFPDATPRIVGGYEFTIERISSTPFWSQRPGQPPDREVPVYSFTVTSLADNCSVELCRPGLTDDHAGGLRGAAVIFRGDTYDERSYQVTDTLRDPDDDQFNIACVGTAISKLHLLRHTAASGGGTTVVQRQAMLRLLTADYCGNGHPFTVDGLPLDLEFDSPRGYAPTSESLYPVTSRDTLDAGWNENGATCLGHPRLLPNRRLRWDPADPANDNRLFAAIRHVCGGSGHELPACSPPPAGASVNAYARGLYDQGAYAISMSPAAPRRR